MHARGAPWWWIGLAAGTAACAVALGGAALNYDVMWSVDWGAAITRGDVPDIAADSAPTSHPLATFVSAVSQLIVGDGTPGVLHLLAFVSYAGLIACAAAVTAKLSGPVAGAGAALVLVLSAPIHDNAAQAFGDVSAAALVLLALLLELRSPRRGTGPLLALAAAGLLRPEAWGLAAAYWLYAARGATTRDRLRLAALAALGPGLWILSDLVLTGEPFLSFTRTREGAEAARRTTGFGQGPHLLVDNLRSTLGAGVLAAAAAGGLAALASLVRRNDDLADRRLALPLAVAVLLCVAFLALAGGELSLLERYVIPLAAVLAVLAGHTIGGWWRARGPLRIAWAALGLAVAVATVATAGSELDRTRASLDFTRDRQHALDQLELQIPPGCRTIAVSSYRFRPYLAHELDRRAGDLVVAADPAIVKGPTAWVATASERSLRGFGPPTGEEPADAATAGFLRRPGPADWALWTRGC